MSARPYTVVDQSSRHRNSAMRSYYVFSAAVHFAPHRAKNARLLAEENWMAKYEQLRLSGLAISDYKNVVRDVRGGKRIKRTTVPVSHTSKIKETGRLRPKRKLYFLPRELSLASVSRGILS